MKTIDQITEELELANNELIQFNQNTKNDSDNLSPVNERIRQQYMRQIEQLEADLRFYTKLQILKQPIKWNKLS